MRGRSRVGEIPFDSERKLMTVGLATPEGTFCRPVDAGKRRRDVLQNLIANHALDVLRRYLTGLPVQ